MAPLYFYTLSLKPPKFQKFFYLQLLILALFLLAPLKIFLPTPLGVGLFDKFSSYIDVTEHFLRLAVQML